MAVLMRGLEEAFTFLGGVPAELLFDHMKAVIVDDERASGGQLLENPESVRFAAHRGFRIRACRPCRARTKGKVERPIGYVLQSFFCGRTFLHDVDLNAQPLFWLNHTANVRRHRTTGDVHTYASSATNACCKDPGRVSVSPVDGGRNETNCDHSAALAGLDDRAPCLATYDRIAGVTQ